MASILKVDDLRGNTSAGNITITSEGGSATMQLQQGVAKMWVHFDGTASGATAQDSFGLSSMADNGTGDYSCTMSNAMSNANYCFQCSIEQNTSVNTNNFGSKDGNAQTTTVLRVACGSETASIDTDEYCVTVLGDMA